MFSGAQISLYPMCDDFVDVILGALSAMDPYRPNFRIETDDISTLIVGPPEQLFPAMRDLFASAAASDVHCVLSATVSRGCPGEPDDPICTPISGSSHELSLAERIGAARAHVDSAKKAWTGGRRAVLALSARRGPSHGRDLRLYRLPQDFGRLRQVEEFLHEAERRRRTGVRDAVGSLPSFRRAARPCRARSHRVGEQPESLLVLAVNGLQRNPKQHPERPPACRQSPWQ